MVSREIVNREAHLKAEQHALSYQSLLPVILLCKPSLEQAFSREFESVQTSFPFIRKGLRRVLTTTNQYHCYLIWKSILASRFAKPFNHVNPHRPGGKYYPSRFSQKNQKRHKISTWNFLYLIIHEFDITSQNLVKIRPWVVRTLPFYDVTTRHF